MIYAMCLIVTMVSSFVSFFFSIAAVFKESKESYSTQNNANYAFSRSLSLVIIVLGILIYPSRIYLIITASIMSLVQLFDGIVGIKISKFKTYGPLATGGVNAILLLVYIFD